MGVASTFHFLNRYRCQINWRGQKPTAKKNPKKKHIHWGQVCGGFKKKYKKKSRRKIKQRKVYLSSLQVCHFYYVDVFIWIRINYEQQLFSNSDSMRQCCRCHWWVYMCLNSSQFPHCVQRSSHSTAAFMLHTIVSRMPLSPSLFCTLWRLLTPTYCLNLISLINKLN